jgi:2,5-diketo-D-gluconate reductase A
VPRAELYVTTKVATADQGFTAVQDAGVASLERLGLDYVDLYLIHWPAPQLGEYVNTWGGIIQLQAKGLARSIGVCNFTDEYVGMVTDLTFVAPVVNQVELHPLLNQSELRRVSADRDLVTEAYGPLGGGKLLDNPVVTSIASAHGKSPAQVLIRWSIQLGNVVLPRSANPERIAQNIDVFDFELSDHEMASLNSLDQGTRFRQDPETYTGS